MKSRIKTIEDLSLNAWPSHQIQVYDGWLLRFSHFYTHRTNSVEQIGPSSIPFKEKIAYCEEIYEKWGTPAIFKISPLIDSSFDQMLTEQGYKTTHTTEVMTLDLENYSSGLYNPDVCIEKNISDTWIQELFQLKGTTNPIHRQIVPSMYRAIPKDTLAASVSYNGKTAAIGLGILDRYHIGIYAIHVSPEFRRKHLGCSVCQAILTEGMKQGAACAYLQVAKGNEPAKRLYSSLGFQNFYTYWFRQQF